MIHPPTLVYDIRDNEAIRNIQQNYYTIVNILRILTIKMVLPASNALVIKENLIQREEIPGPPPFLRILCTQPQCYIPRYRGPWRQDFRGLILGSSANIWQHYERTYHEIFQRFSNQRVQASQSQPSITQSFTPTVIPQDKYRQLFLHFITQNNLPLDLASSTSFREFVSFLNPKIQHISRRTLRRDLEIAYTLSKEALRQLLRKYTSNSGYISLTTDTWSSSAYKEFAVVTAHWLDDNFNPYS